MEDELRAQAEAEKKAAVDKATEAERQAREAAEVAAAKAKADAEEADARRRVNERPDLLHSIQTGVKASLSWRCAMIAVIATQSRAK